MKRFALVMAVVLVVLAGCNDSGNSVTENLLPLTLASDPVVQVSRDPDVDFGKYKTFDLVPADSAKGVPPAFGDALTEKQVSRLVGAMLEAYGYRKAGPSEAPDFLVVLTGSNDYKTHETGPIELTDIAWQHGETVNSTVSNRHGVKVGEVRSTTPGRWTTEKRTLPSVTVGRYLPYIGLNWLDYKTSKWVWRGNACGACKNPDVRVSCQIPLYALAAKMPAAEEAVQRRGSGSLGMGYWLGTLDGETLYPFARVTRDKSAARAGVKDYDLIAAINGTSCAGKTWPEIGDMLSGDADTICALTLIRGKKVLEVKVKRAPL